MKNYLFIILVINAVALAVLGNHGPSTTYEALGLFAMANIADSQQVVLPEAFGQYPEAVKIEDNKYLAPQPLWQQIGGSIAYKIAKVFFGVDRNWAGLQKFYRVVSYFGNLIASTILILLFARALAVKGVRGKEVLLMLVPLAFFSLVFTAGMTLQVHLFVAALCFWALHEINNGVYRINRDLPFRNSFIFTGVLLAFAGCLSIPAIGVGIGFLAMFITQKDSRFSRAAFNMIVGALVPIILTVIFIAIYSKQTGGFIPPWPEAVVRGDDSPGAVLRYFFNSTIGFNGFFLYSPLALVGVISLAKRMNHFQKLAERKKKLDHYARGQSLIAMSVYWGGILSLVLFWLAALMNGVPPKFAPEHLQMLSVKIGGDSVGLEANLRNYGTMQLLFLLPLLHHFNLHIFKERPFAQFKVFYHEVVRVGGLVAIVGLASPAGGYLVPFVWSLNQIALSVTSYFPMGTLLW